MKRVLVLCFIFMMGLLNQAIAQQQFIPEFFTNRPLILLNDATTAGWNPAVLGIDTKADLAFLASYDRSMRSSQLFGAFYSQNGLGFGITTQRNEQLPTYSFIPFSFYAGGGVKIPNERAWAGASFRYSEFGNSSIRFNGSFIYQPMENFYVSAGITNFNSLNSDNLQYQFSSSYALLDWLNLFGRIQFTSDSMLFAGEKRSIDIGINASIQKNVINTSFFVNPVLREARFGLECSIGAFTVGALNEGSTINNPDSRFRGGNFLLRIDPEHFDAPEEEPCETVSCDVKGCKGRACTRALYGAYRCIRTNCPGIPCRDNCFGPECHPKEECTNHCPICQHPIINNWTFNILIKPHCTFCSCTHSIHNTTINNYWNYFFPTKYIIRVDTVIQWRIKYIIDTVYKYKTDTIIKVINDCSGCDHDCSKCKHECPKCPDCTSPGGPSPGGPGDKDPGPGDKDPGPGDKDPGPGDKDPGPGDKDPVDPPLLPPDCEDMFESDSCTLKPEMNDCYDKVVEYLLKQNDMCIIIRAHTDSQGSEEYNLALSQCRADFIKSVFVQKGIDLSRIEAIGLGESQPIADNSTAEGRRRNRRVETIYIDCSEIFKSSVEDEVDIDWKDEE